MSQRILVFLSHRFELLLTELIVCFLLVLLMLLKFALKSITVFVTKLAYPYLHRDNHGDHS